ncbi:lasso RiPP family leader peptide-containing protein [Salinigranum rubrum]|nr:lasso RiPP family leader peptide-containing protein [Salinigranum rubrum]
MTYEKPTLETYGRVESLTQGGDYNGSEPTYF